ncbi:MAG: hypothetical protein HN350_13430 [Phycisphaerales bacterium]|jgi:hypothetical protein|nr:hypothetical protein [Phycisphaerales bacterium]
MLLTSQRYDLVLAALAVAALLSGCAPAELTISGQDVKLPGQENSAAFLDRMSSLDTVTQNDALRGIMMLEDADPVDTFKQRVDFLIEKNILPPTGAYDAQSELSRGQLAKLICSACEIKGSVIMRLTGYSERYCLRELQYREMIVRGSGDTKISGMEFASVLTRAATYKQTQKYPDLVGETE